MGLVLKLFGGPFGGYALIAIAVTLLGSFGYAAYEHQAAARYQVERDAATNENTQLKEALSSKEGTITALADSNDRWAAAAKLSQDESKLAGERAAGYTAELTKARARLNALAENDRDSEICNNLFAADFAAACPSHADILRQWSDRGLQGSAH